MDCRLATSGVRGPSGLFGRRGVGDWRRVAACLLGGLLLLGGCQSLREKSARRSAECSDLCSQAAAAHETGRSDEARLLLEEAMRQRPDDTEARTRLAETMWQLGRKEQALAEFSRLAHESRSDVKLLSRYATALCETGQIQEAEVWAQSALSVDPVNADALLVRARCAAQRADYAASLAAYHELLQVAPEHAEARLGMAQVQIARGQPELAAPVLRSLLQHPWSSTLVQHEAEWSLGRAYAAVGRWEDAAPLMERAIAHRAATADDWCQLATAQARCGRNEASVTSVRHALQLDSRHAGARQLSQELAEGSSGGGVKPARFESPSRPEARTALHSTDDASRQPSPGLPPTSSGDGQQDSAR